MTHIPNLAICSLFRDSVSADDLDTYIAQINTLDWPPDQVRVFTEEGDSQDDTWERLQCWAAQDRRVTPFKNDTGAPRWLSVADPDRIRHLDKCAQTCKAAALRDDWAEYILWVESDLIWQPELASRLWQRQKDIIAPWVWCNGYAEGSRNAEHLWTLPRKGVWFYDTWGFTYLGGQHFCDTARRPAQPIQIATAGSCLLMTRKAAEAAKAVTGNATPGWCEQAREAGFKVWADPDTVVWHPWPRPGAKGGMRWVSESQG